MHMVYLPQKGGDKHVYTTTRKKMNETIAEALGALEGQITPAPEKIPAGMAVIGIELDRDPACSAQYVTSITLAAPLHDIGKIKIPDSVLKKQGDLTEEEFELMKTHTIEGAKILEECAKQIDDNYYLLLGKDMAAYHHEWWNGKGYPYGLKGIKIPCCARVLAVADVFDALVSKRSYKQQMSFDQAFEIIKKGSGGHFDPEIVNVFLSVRPEIERVALLGIDDWGIDD